jgi:hypothetical protein
MASRAYKLTRKTIDWLNAKNEYLITTEDAAVAAHMFDAI